jgi:hypothetical protein
MNGSPKLLKVCCFSGIFRCRVTQTQYHGAPAWLCPHFVNSNYDPAVLPPFYSAEFEDNFRPRYTLYVPENSATFRPLSAEALGLALLVAGARQQ